MNVQASDLLRSLYQGPPLATETTARKAVKIKNQRNVSYTFCEPQISNYTECESLLAKTSSSI